MYYYYFICLGAVIGISIFIQYFYFHSKSLYPVIQELANGFKSSPLLLVAQMDLDSNRLPRNTITIQSVPTLVYLSSCSRIRFSAVKNTTSMCVNTFDVYQGHRDLLNISKFVLNKLSN